MAEAVPVQLNISINDDVVGFIEKKPGNSEIESYGEVKLPKGVVDRGYIKDPITLVDKIQSIYNSFKIEAKTVRWVLNEQNAILRELEIEKGELQQKSIEEYILSQVGKTIHFPFETPVFNHFVKDIKDDSYVVIIIIMDEQMINDYLDVFERLKIKDITYEIPMLALFRLFYTENEGEDTPKTNYSQVQLSNAFQSEKKNGLDSSMYAKAQKFEGQEDDDVDEDNGDLIDGLMLVTLYDKYFTLTIFSNIYPTLFIMEDIEVDDKMQIIDKLDNFISRISNYYKYNKCDGKKQVRSCVCFNLSAIDDELLAEEMGNRTLGMPFEVFDLGSKSQYYKRLLPKGCYIPLAASFYRTTVDDEEE